MFDNLAKQTISPAENLKSAMRDTCNMVYVVSTGREKPHRNAITITSFTVISLEPASVLFCVNKTSRFAENILNENIFCINIMPIHLEKIAEACSGAEIKVKFDFDEWRYRSGLPYLVSAIANIICIKSGVIESGSHLIITCTVTQILSSGKAPPLLYHDRQYKTLPTLTDI